MSTGTFNFDEESQHSYRPQPKSSQNVFATLLIRYSGGLIKTETQANLCLSAAAIIVIIIAIAHYQSSQPPRAPGHLRGLPEAELEAYRAVQPF